jgi:thioester reductase-like protein
MAAALNQQQQLKNEATKMAMRVPLLYGNEKEDTMNIKDFITRFESACTAMGLADDASQTSHYSKTSVHFGARNSQYAGHVQSEVLGPVVKAS